MRAGSGFERTGKNCVSFELWPHSCPRGCNAREADHARTRKQIFRKIKHMPAQVFKPSDSRLIPYLLYLSSVNHYWLPPARTLWNLAEVTETTTVATSSNIIQSLYILSRCAVASLSNQNHTGFHCSVQSSILELSRALFKGQYSSAHFRIYCLVVHLKMLNFMK